MYYGTIGTNPWYVSNVTVNWQVRDPESPITSSSGCNATTLVTETPGTTLTCSAESAGGTKTVTTKRIMLDKTAPAVSAWAGRGADSNGWYNHAVTVSFSGTDATSGPASCTSATYGGPDNANAVVTGSCRDNAGNVGSGAFGLKYDSTAPTVSGVGTRPLNRAAEVYWQASPDTKLVEVTRAPGTNGAPWTVVYSGTGTNFRDTGLTAGRRYTYMVAVTDEAANRGGTQVKHVGTGALLRPAPAERVTAPPLLVWTRVRGATYYHVQLIRGTRVLVAWTTGTSLQLKRTWLMHGRRQRLRPGTYRWYVWPGHGRLSAARYGVRLGGSTFVVTK